MFNATGSKHPQRRHFFLGLLCAAAGRLVKRNQMLSQRNLCEETRAMCAGLVSQEKERASPKPKASIFFSALGLAGAG
jgi:triphosphoribosyl-dephospho-CoA synthase